MAGVPHAWLTAYRKSCRRVVLTQMKIDAFPCPSRYIDGKEKMSSAASHQGIVHNNEVRPPDLQAEASAEYLKASGSGH